MHYSSDVNEIKDSLNELGHEVIHIWNVKQRDTNKHVPMFFIDIKQAENNKDVYSIKLLMNKVVIFEAPRAKNIICAVGGMATLRTFAINSHDV